MQLTNWKGEVSIFELSKRISVKSLNLPFQNLKPNLINQYMKRNASEKITDPYEKIL